jgi:hypothetical protein
VSYFIAAQARSHRQPESPAARRRLFFLILRRGKISRSIFLDFDIQIRGMLTSGAAQADRQKSSFGAR